MSRYEEAFILEISDSGTRTFLGFDDSRLVKAAEYAHQVLIQELVEYQAIKPERLPSKKARSAFRILCIAAGVLAYLQIQALIERPNDIFTILYPRYAVDFSQVLTLVVILLIVLAVLASSFWPRFTKDPKSNEYSAWIDATGLFMYVRTVFKDRFSLQNISTQDTTTLRDYSQYAIAYGVIPASPSVVARIIDAAGE